MLYHKSSSLLHRYYNSLCTALPLHLNADSPFFCSVYSSLSHLSFSVKYMLIFFWQHTVNNIRIIKDIHRGPPLPFYNIIIQILYEYSNILHLLFTRRVYAVYTDSLVWKKGNDNFLFIHMLSIVIAAKPLSCHRGFFWGVLKVYMFLYKNIYFHHLYFILN